MKVFISADIEGVGGVMARTHWHPDGADYKKACGWMLQEVNAAVEGALQAGAKTVIVRDAHNTATNLDLNDLHPAAELLSGWGPLGSMVEGVDETFDAVFLVGYHPRVGTQGGTLAHTWSANVLNLSVNDKTCGETGWAAMYAGHFNVPIALVTGDDKLSEQVASELPAGVHTVITKFGSTYNAARMRPLQTVRDEIRQTAARALSNAGTIAPLKIEYPVKLTIRFREWEMIHVCEAMPGVQRLDAHTFQCQPADIIEAQKYFVTLHRLSRS